MAFQRKYKFNWLDHLYYLGKYTAGGVGVWSNLMLALSVLPLTLLLFCLIHILADQKYNAAIMQVSIYSRDEDTGVLTTHTQSCPPLFRSF